LGFQTEFAMDDINMIEFMGCVPELIIVVDERDALRSCDTIEKLSGIAADSHPKT
jgi:hypothetical protein